MTDILRRAAQKLIEHLDAWDLPELYGSQAVENLRAALAQPAQKPDKELLCVCGCDWQWSAEQKMWELVASRAQPAQEHGDEDGSNN